MFSCYFTFLTVKALKHSNLMDLLQVLTITSPLLSAAQIIYLNEKPIQLGSLLDVKPGLIEEKPFLLDEKPDQVNPNITIIHGLTEDKGFTKWIFEQVSHKTWKGLAIMIKYFLFPARS
jgi:hypothetical protein